MTVYDRYTIEKTYSVLDRCFTNSICAMSRKNTPEENELIRKFRVFLCTVKDRLAVLNSLELYEMPHIAESNKDKIQAILKEETRLCIEIEKRVKAMAEVSLIKAHQSYELLPSVESIIQKFDEDFNRQNEVSN